ncbi:MAG: HD-GYP domain-containing protein [Desulfobacteraceae bacterium]|nr:MAG: HD-GYP domain-containing protein [Desulfobacteraceae bacterium]
MTQHQDKPLYNSRIIHSYVQLVKKNYPDINVKGLLADAGMKPHEVDDQGHWFTQHQIDRFYERLVVLTENENIAREAGRFSASPETIGVMRQYILGMATPAKAYQFIEKASAGFTHSSRFESKMLASNTVQITVTPYAGTNEKPFQCENRKGFFDAVTMIFNHREPRIEHPECIFKGDSCCRYIISWEKTFYNYLNLIKNYITLFLIAAGLLMAFFFPLGALIPAYAIFAVLILSVSLIAVRMEKNNLNDALQNLKDSTDQLVDQIEINYNNRLITREIGQIVNRYNHLDDVLTEVVSVLDKRLDFDRGLIMLANKEGTLMNFRAGFGYTEEQYNVLQKLYFHLDNPSSKGVFVICFKEKKPKLINDINEFQETLSSKSVSFAQKMGAKSFICCPIICDNESIGILAVDNIQSRRLLVHSDMSLLMGISHFIGISIRHTQHLESQKKQLKSVLKVLVSSIDARDPVTKGHSEWVAEFSAGICDELGLNKEDGEVVRVAALLHDYGKIGIPDSMLKKADKLTEHEYEYVKYHVDKTKEILEQINFEGPLKAVPEIAAAHHEKFDGSGYPQGVRGEDIPLGARIIAVADYFEALTANRYYNEPMPPDQVIEILKEKSGTFFDQQVVTAFIQYYQKKFIHNNGGLLRASTG